MDSLGERIRKIRVYRGMTQKELAHRAGIEEALMRRYEYGERNPKDNQLEKIAHALNVGVANLRVRSEPMLELLPAFLNELIDEYEDFEIIEQDGSFAISINSKGLGYQWNEALRIIKEKKATLPNDEFENWLRTATKTTLFLERAHEKLKISSETDI